MIRPSYGIAAQMEPLFLRVYQQKHPGFMERFSLSFWEWFQASREQWVILPYLKNITRLTECWLNSMLFFLFIAQVVSRLSGSSGYYRLVIKGSFHKNSSDSTHTFSKMDCTIAGPTSIMLNGCIVLHFRMIYTNTVYFVCKKEWFIIMAWNHSTATESFLT